MSKYTPGPWSIGYGGGVTGARAAASVHWDETDVKEVVIRKGNEVVCYVASVCEEDDLLPDARLIAVAPAMDIALSLIALGLARIERSGRLVEFCFDGLRYCMNGDWGALFDVIGWDKARAAIAKATGESE